MLWGGGTVFLIPISMLFSKVGIQKNGNAKRERDIPMEGTIQSFGTAVSLFGF